jgi:hypothetical protein
MAKTFSKEDVASHTKDNTPWIIIDEDVYDVSKFQDEHPGKFHIPATLRRRLNVGVLVRDDCRITWITWFASHANKIMA